MKPLRYVGTDEVLSTEQGLVLRNRAVLAARRQFVARRLFPIGPALGEGALTFGYDVHTEVADARIDYGWPGAESLDDIASTRTTKEIPNIHREFEINKLDLAASRMTGTPLNLAQVDSAAYKVALMEDALLILGWTRDGTNYDINGLYKAAGNNTAGADFTTKANIETSILAAIALLEADGIYAPYNMVLNPAQYAETLATIANTGITYREYLEKTIEGTVFQTPAMPATTGMVVKANGDGMFEYVMAEDLTVFTEVLPRSHNLFGKVYIRGLPVVYDGNAICQLTAI
jgi:uncharacterized linocin/CFP29 family protein